MKKPSTTQAMTSIVLVGFIAIFSITGPFLHEFYNRDWSESVEQWGQTGDYFGGFLNPIFTFLSLCTTVYIASIVNKINERQIDIQQSAHLQQIETQNIILKRQLQHEAAKDFSRHWTTILEETNRALDRKDHLEVSNCVMAMMHHLWQFKEADSNLFQCMASEPMIDAWGRVDQFIDIWLSQDDVIDYSHLADVEMNKPQIIGMLYKEIAGSIK